MNRIIPVAAHELDLDEIDEIDETDGDEMLALVWCFRHKCYEWHWIPRR